MRDTIDMAREAGWLSKYDSPTGFCAEAAFKFEALVRADEREACARVCETLWDTPDNGMCTEEECYGNQCAGAIRARGNT